MQRLGLVLVVLLALSTAASAQTPLPTARLPLPGVTTCRQILSAVGVTTAGNSLDTRGFSTGTWEVIPTGTCGTYTVVLQATGNANSPVWSTIATVDQAEAAVGAARNEPVPMPQGWVRAVPTVNPGTCTATVYFCGRP